MRKIITLFLAMGLAVVANAQQKKIEFTQKFTYQTVTGKHNDNMQLVSFMDVFANNNEGLVQTKPKNVDYYGSQSFFYDDEGFSWVGFGMNNQLIYNPQYDIIFNVDYDKKPNYEVISLNTKEKVGSYQCSHYLLKYQNQNYGNDTLGADDPDSHSVLKICIDDRNTINNSNLLFIMTNYYGVNASAKNVFPKGLVVKIGDEKEYDTEYTMLAKSEKIQQTVHFDRKKEIQKEAKHRDSIQLAMEKYDNKEVLDTTKDAVKADSAQAAEDEVADGESYDLPKYESAYKKNNPDGNNLAIDHELSNKQKNALPGYCFRIENDLSKFSNKEVAKHLKNYAGQVCDMYLSQGENHTIYIKGTVDEIRKEVVWLTSQIGKLAKDDQKMLKEYLDNLD